MLDLVISGGQVVTPRGVGRWDVAVQGEKIVALAAPGTLKGIDIGRVIDATGKIIMPGGIDPHIHSKWPIPNPKGGPPGFSGPPPQSSRAALFGGTTTIIDFAVWTQSETLQESIEKRAKDWTGQCYCDYAFHVMLQGRIPEEILRQLPEAIQAGFPSIKIFTTDITPSRRGRKIGYGDIWEILQILAEHGGIAAIHAEDDDLVMHMYDKLIREGRVSFEQMAEVHNTLSEDLSFRRIIRLAEKIEGAALYMMHVSASTGVVAIEESRAKGYPIYGETLHQYALFSAEDYRRPNGQIYHTYPSLKGAEDHQALWRGMDTGTIGAVATDGICTTLAVKIQGRRIDDTTGGNSGIEPRIGIMYTEMVAKRAYPLEKFVDRTSANAARIMGLYPRKGAIAPGSDADIVILAPNIRRTIRKEDLHETDYSPWEGWEVAGWPSLTLLRGKVVVEDGRFYGSLDDGKRIDRKVSDAILSGPTV
jgi:dihydropyrimidinase